MNSLEKMSGGKLGLSPENSHFWQFFVMFARCGAIRTQNAFIPQLELCTGHWSQYGSLQSQVEVAWMESETLTTCTVTMTPLGFL